MKLRAWRVACLLFVAFFGFTFYFVVGRDILMYRRAQGMVYLDVARVTSDLGKPSYVAKHGDQFPEKGFTLKDPFPLRNEVLVYRTLLYGDICIFVESGKVVHVTRAVS
jgi:hypothetical protein